FLVIERVDVSPTLQLLRWTLDKGEAEAMYLALSKKARLFLVDEKHAWALRLLKNLSEVTSGRAMNMGILSLMESNKVMITSGGVTELELRLKGVRGNK
ncbi:MAG: hypothetical protein AAB856_02280, partial [Patescibacteria group bacterium]